MIKVLQYGEGNFLRTFVDVYFDTLSKNGQGMYAVNIVKPITFGTLERFKSKQASIISYCAVWKTARLWKTFTR